MIAHTPITLEDVNAAQTRIQGIARRTPLLSLEIPGGRTVHLKLESLQPVGSFKIRGAANAMMAAPRETLAQGVYTASAGNMAQGVAYCARALGVPAAVVVPDRAPQTKLDAIARFGARVVRVSFDAWWQAMVDHGYAGEPGVFVHPFEDPLVMAGNGTIALEVLGDLPSTDAVLVPWGGGGLACGVASALRARGSKARVYPVEVETAAPLTASFAAGHAATIVPSPNFVDGMSGKSVFPSMWTRAQGLVEQPIVVSVAQIASAVKFLAERGHIVAEGAGAATVAAAIAAERTLANNSNVVCVISGGNIDTAKLVTILRDEIP